MPHIILLGTLDTKLTETLYIHNALHETAKTLHFPSPLKVTLIDCGREDIAHPLITIPHRTLLENYDAPSINLSTLPRAEVITHLTKAATTCVRTLLSSKTNQVHGIIGTGGSGGTSLISAVMRDAAPIGLPKLIVSTIASGETGSVVGECDITLMYSVVDIAGMNRVLGDVLGNAAGAILGMAGAYEGRVSRQHLPTKEGEKEGGEGKIRLGITMFGVTTPAVNHIRAHLATKYPAVEPYIFHATGHGGKAMERLVTENRLDAILDLTTTEIVDYIARGNMACDASRLEPTLRRGIPNVISLGATDMVNFGPEHTVPPKFRDQKRNLQVHNPSVTLMRTSREEARRVGEFIVDKVKRFAREPGMVEIWIPRGGVSIMSTPGGVFADGEADRVLFEVLRDGLEGSGVRVVVDERDVNDQGFAVDIAESAMGLVRRYT
ncbi:hypothetical protein BJX99DRAFT_255751 [Aspergillus californicus]